MKPVVIDQGMCVADLCYLCSHYHPVRTGSWLFHYVSVRREKQYSDGHKRFPMFLLEPQVDPGMLMHNASGILGMTVE
jgi:hypothetical protein